MQLGLVEALVVTLYHRHPLTEQPQSPFRLPDPAVGFRYQRKKGRLPKARAGGPQVGQALAHLRASVFVAALLDQCPAAQNRPMDMNSGKPCSAQIAMDASACSRAARGSCRN